MKLRQLLISTAMMCLTLVSAQATTPSVPSPLIDEDKILGSAYYDTLSILSTSNLCSDFFGGPAASVDAFNHLIGRLRTEYLSGSIAMRMTGQTTNMLNAATNKQYRLFEKVVLNAKGPFYRSRFSNSDPSVFPIGPFEPNTKQARVLIFLHELGHVVKGNDGEWLLPNDGGNAKVSKENTRRIQGICGDQIEGLRKSQTKMLLAGRKHTNEDIVPISVKP